MLEWQALTYEKHPGKLFVEKQRSPEREIARSPKTLMVRGFSIM